MKVYTEMKDSAGTRIACYDVIERRYEEDGEACVRRAVVCPDGSGERIMIVGYLGIAKLDMREVKVVGNIEDDPELADQIAEEWKNERSRTGDAGDPI